MVSLIPLVSLTTLFNALIQLATSAFSYYRESTKRVKFQQPTKRFHSGGELMLRYV